MKNRCFITAAGAVLLAFAGSACSSLGFQSRQEIAAAHTAAKIQLDGKLDETAWQKTPVYFLAHSRNQFKNQPPEVGKFFSRGVAEPGKIRLLWNEKYLYIGIEFSDSDLIAEHPGDQAYHPLKGDAAEVFLKPLNQTWYWVLQVTPRGNKTSLFFPGRGWFGLPSTHAPKQPALPGMKAAAFCKGTLNNPWDKDKKWTAEIAVPRSELAMAGEKLDPEVPWLIFFGRYNYGRYLPVRENSSFPALDNANYHTHEEYGLLKMMK